MGDDTKTEVRVLVVDDDHDLRSLVLAILEDDGLVGVEASSAEAARAMLDDEPIDVVLTDLVMPNVDGMTLLRMLQVDHPTLPVIMMTAKRSVEDAVEAMKAGASDFVLKPLDRDELL